ncbi:MAG: zinc-binding alcohol dehydrogenase [Pseudomonadota bacterium]
MIKDEAGTAPDGAVLVDAAFSAISRGTERLVLEGRVPRSEWERMRCPHQGGTFPFPVKYGYALVGTAQNGPHAGQRVFCLHPHQTRAAVSPDDVIPLPDAVPTQRAALAANMETALTIVWDCGAAPGDHVLVVGAGVVGLLTARLLARHPGVIVTVCDVDDGKRGAAEALGAKFSQPDDAPHNQDAVIHTSAVPAGLTTALQAAAPGARVVEASWYGDRAVSVPLGEDFHVKRLTLRSSQVGTIPPERSARWSHRRRLSTALKLLEDPALDCLLTHTIPFDEAPQRLPGLMNEPGPLAILLAYPPFDRLPETP